MNIRPAVIVAYPPDVPESDVFFNTQWLTRELMTLAAQLPEEIARLERGRIARDFALMRSACLSLDDITDRTAQLKGSLARALEIHTQRLKGEVR